MLALTSAFGSIQIGAMPVCSIAAARHMERSKKTAAIPLPEVPGPILRRAGC
jgi:hypothetical protein